MYEFYTQGSRKKQGARLGTVIFETAGQFVYVRTMSGAAPMIAAYSIVSIILSRSFFKEMLPIIAVIAIMAGIIILGVLEGIE